MWVLLQGSPFSLGKEEYTAKGYLEQKKKCGGGFMVQLLYC